MSKADDVELAADLVGVASARLLAAGVSRGDRLGAMRLLGILTTVADSERRVRRPLEDVALEFALPPGLAAEWAGYLEDVGVLRREGTTTLLAGVEPVHSALRLQDFLDAAAELDERPVHRANRLVRPAGALLAAAAVAAAFLLAPGIVRDRTTTASSSGGAPSATTTSSSAVDVPAGVPPTSGRPKGSASVPSSATTPTQAPAVGPVIQPTTTTPPSGTPCPTGVPLLQVLGTTTDAGGHLAVDGVAQNPTDVDVQIETFTVHTTVGGQDVATAGTTRPIVVPARSSILWEASLPVVAPAGTPARVTLGDWGWHGPSAPLACPSP